MALRETENNAYAKFWDDKQRVLWYVMIFSGVVNWEFTVEFKLRAMLHWLHCVALSKFITLNYL